MYLDDFHNEREALSSLLLLFQFSQSPFLPVYPTANYTSNASLFNSPCNNLPTIVAPSFC